MLSTLASSTLVAHDHYNGPGGWWPIFPILWFAFIVFAFVMFARFGWGRRRWHNAAHSGEARLAERYASGEIDEDEYRERLAVLKEERR